MTFFAGGPQLEAKAALSGAFVAEGCKAAF